MHAIWWSCRYRFEQRSDIVLNWNSQTAAPPIIVQYNFLIVISVYQIILSIIAYGKPIKKFDFSSKLSKTSLIKILVRARKFLNIANLTLYIIIVNENQNSVVFNQSKFSHTFVLERYEMDLTLALYWNIRYVFSFKYALHREEEGEEWLRTILFYRYFQKKKGYQTIIKLDEKI